MPTYEYACRDCGQHVEVVQSFRDDPLTVCPGCGGRLRKVFGAAGIIFKGSGYYVTDSRKQAAQAAKANGGSESKESKEPAASGDGAAKGEGATSEGTKADTASAAKSA